MNPSAYMPLYGDDFFRAVEGWPDTVAIGYLRAIWHNWTHEHAQGLRDDDEHLRKVCRIDRADWESVRAIIFDNDKFFQLSEDGRWHQKRLDIEYVKAKEAYELAVKRGRAGGLSRARNMNPAQLSRIGKLGGRPKNKPR